MFKKIYIVPLILLTIIGTCLMIKTSLAEEEKELFGSISGKVTTENETTGIKGVYVEVKDKEGKEPVDICKTSTDGFYKIRRVPPGKYQLEVEEEGFVTAIKKNIVVQAGEETKDVNFILTKPNSISGRILKADGITPVNDVWVLIMIPDDECGKYVDIESKVTLSDTDGIYKFENIPEGNYMLIVSASHGEPLAVKKNIEIKKDSVLADVNIIVSEPEKYGSISGKVLKSDGKTPVSDVMVFASGKKGKNWASLSDENGNYKIERLIKDIYEITVFTIKGEEIGLQENVEVKKRKDTININVITSLK